MLAAADGLRCNLPSSARAQVKLEHTAVIMSSAAGQEVTRRGLLMAGESGIFTPEHRQYIGDAGCHAMLVGESLVKAPDPAEAVRTLLS